MQHRAATDLWQQYHALSPEVRARADKQFSLLKANSQHPSLQLRSPIASRSRVSRTRKDSNQFTNTALEVVKRDNGTFDLFLNRKLDRSCVSEAWLSEELCARFGFCGEEYDAILR